MLWLYIFNTFKLIVISFHHRMLYATFGWSELNIFEEIENVHCLQRQHMIKKKSVQETLTHILADVEMHIIINNSVSIVDIQKL